MTTPPSTKPKPTTFTEIGALWGTLRAFACDLGLPYPRVHKWIRSGLIPQIYWDSVIALALSRHGVQLTPGDLHNMAVPTLRRRASRSARKDAA